MPVDDAILYLAKAEESLAGAASELASSRFNNTANRAYYACFQAAVAALVEAGVRPGASRQWGHEYVQAEFIGRLINRQKRYLAEFRFALAQGVRLRHEADYDVRQVSESEARRAVQRAERFARIVREKVEGAT